MKKKNVLTAYEMSFKLLNTAAVEQSLLRQGVLKPKRLAASGASKQLRACLGSFGHDKAASGMSRQARKYESPSLF